MPGYFPGPQPLSDKTDEVMKFDGQQLDPAGERFFGRPGWSNAYSGIDIPSDVSRAEAIASGGVPFVLANDKAKKPAANKKSKKEFLAGGVKKVTEGGDHKKMSEREMHAYEKEHAKDMRGDWSGQWPPKRIAAVRAQVLVAHSGVDEFVCLDSKT